MEHIPDRPDLKQEATELLRQIIDAVQAREHPEFIDAISHDDGIDVTVKPEALDHAVTITLHVISAAVIPWRPRRRRR